MYHAYEFRPLTLKFGKVTNIWMLLFLKLTTAYPSGHSPGLVGSVTTDSLLRHQYPGGQPVGLRFDRHTNPRGHSAESNSRFFLHQYPGGHPGPESSSCSSVISSAAKTGDNTPNRPSKRATSVN